MKLKLIIFDFSGTLAYLKNFDFEKFFSHLANFGVELKTEEEKNSFISFCSEIWGRAENWLDLSQKLLKKYIQKPAQSSIKLLAKFFKKNIVFELYDDVKEIFDLPFQKAVLSGNAKFLIEELGLEKFAKIFTPRETKFLKPDVRTFLAVLEKLKVKPEETLIVGNEVERDLIPAQNLGMEVILIDRGNKAGNPPVKKISSLKELKKILI